MRSLIYQRLKNKATALRKQGLSYSEIKQNVNVSKSTLSLWLRNVKLSNEQRERLKEMSKVGQPVAAKLIKERRLQRTRDIIKKAKREIGKIKKKELLYIGAVLYWAEGSKQKDHNPSQRVTFNNSDPLIIRIFLKWLADCLQVGRKDIDFEIYSHENIREREEDVIKYWSEVTGFRKSRFGRVYYKKDKKRKYRKNKGNKYYGLLRVQVLKSTDLNRRISGLVEGICEQCRVV